MRCGGGIFTFWWFSIVIYLVRARTGHIYWNCMSSSIVDKNVCKMIAAAKLEGSIVFTPGPQIREASSDFGGIYKRRPAAVLSPACVEDIRKLIRIAAASPDLTIAARGNGHSLGGQPLAINGIVVNMTTLKGIHVVQHSNEYYGSSYVDVKAGEFWVDVLRTTLDIGLAPRSWTDYIDLSIGGTLSNAGISGQAFRFGPQISNVVQLEVVTGKGEVINCSAENQSDLFFGALGGLGQFGIITGARIVLHKAYQRASQWRFVYWNFTDFMHDQELLLSLPQGQTFDYVEGFIKVNRDDPIKGWPSIPFSPNVTFNATLIPPTASAVLYVIEATFYYDTQTDPNKIVSNISSRLGFIKGFDFNLDTSYFDFLYRVHAEEVADRSNGIWYAPHVWLNLFVPKSGMILFDRKVFNGVLKNGVDGLIITYPLVRSLWDPRMSAVIPEDEEDDIFYVVSVLRFNKKYPEGPLTSALLAQNKKILELCKAAGIRVKQYLARHETQLEWKEHFAYKWDIFLRRKKIFDPKAILAPGQNIFRRWDSPKCTNTLQPRTYLDMRML